MSKRKLKLLSISHSYVISLNRKLAFEIARAGKEIWDISVVAPSIMKGDLRTAKIEVDKYQNYKLEVVPTYLSKYIHFMYYGYKLNQVLLQDWDLIHCWEEPYVLSGFEVSFFKPKDVPLIYRTAQSLSKSYPLPFNWFELYSMEQANGWICSGKTVESTLFQRKGYEKPHKLIPLGVDIEHFYPDSQARSETLTLLNWTEPRVPVIGYLGRLLPEKGITFLMHVLDNLITPWRALFVGTGPLDQLLRKWAEKYSDRVRICTEVKHNEVPQYLNAMDVLCAPSQTFPNWREQFGRMLIEAMACGIPVIGSDSGEIPNVLDGVGRVESEKDIAAWVKAISELIDNPQIRQEMSLKGLEKVRNLYAWPKIAQQHLEFFKQIREDTV